MPLIDTRIGFFGDSLVNGTGDETGLGWVGRVIAAAQSEARQITYYNLGVRRETSADVLRRYESEVRPRLQGQSDARVVFSFGVNDCVLEEGQRRVLLEDSLKHARQLLIQASAQYKVVMVGPPPIADADINTRIAELSQAYAGLCAELNTPFIEVFSALVDDAHYLAEIQANDGAHPRSSGYARLAEIISSSKHWWF